MTTQYNLREGEMYTIIFSDTYARAINPDTAYAMNRLDGVLIGRMGEWLVLQLPDVRNSVGELEAGEIVFINPEYLVAMRPETYPMPGIDTLERVSVTEKRHVTVDEPPES